MKIAPSPFPAQQEVVDNRRLITRPWLLAMQASLDKRTYGQGTHQERIDGGPANYLPGGLYWETDRTVLYQLRVVPDPDTGKDTREWVYVSGIMTDTLLTPDERPIDLGPLDTGFQFAATDTGTLLLWNGTLWLDITPYPGTAYGTHAERLAAITADIADGTLGVETDRGNVLYQIQDGAWWYIAGIMDGTTTPDQRPTDLGLKDIDFTFRDTADGSLWTWSGAAWSGPGTSLLLQETAYAMVLQNSWANYGGAFQTASYLRDRNGWVHLRGLIKDGTLAAGTVLTTLLAGYRPLAVEILPAYYAGGMARIDVETGGNVVLMSTLSSNAFLSLSGLSFSMQV